MFECEDCGWGWPLPGDPPAPAECDNCGGKLVRAEPVEQFDTNEERDGR